MVLEPMSGTPPVTIGMPIYNGEAYLRLALESLLAQDYSDFALIISDNASTDATESICREFAARDKRIDYHRNASNLGSAANFNRVFQMSKSPYFMWAAHDDLWSPRYVSRCALALERNPSCVACLTGLGFIDEQGQKLDWDYAKYDNPDLTCPDMRERVRRLCSRSGWYGVYGLMRSAVLRQTSLFQEVYGPDLVLTLELCLKGPFAKVSEELFYYRQYRTKKETDRAFNIRATAPIMASRKDLRRSLLSTVDDACLGRLARSQIKRDIRRTFLVSPLRPSMWLRIRGTMRVRTRLKKAWRRMRRVLG